MCGGLSGRCSQLKLEVDIVILEARLRAVVFEAGTQRERIADRCEAAAIMQVPQTMLAPSKGRTGLTSPSSNSRRTVEVGGRIKKSTNAKTEQHCRHSSLSQNWTMEKSCAADPNQGRRHEQRKGYRSNKER
ncbi:MAG: hypothetical protein V3V01_09100 [Acidimicrobiales bacterium]